MCIMHRIGTTRTAALVAAFLAALAADLSAATAAEAETEVVHRWLAPSERAAMDALKTAFEARGGRWRDTAVKGSKLHRQVITDRFADGIPPAAYQWVAGRGIAELAKLWMLRPVDRVKGRRDWTALLAPPVLDRVSLGDDLMLVPIALHVENVLWTNEAVFARLGLAPPNTWDELFAAADAMTAAGIAPMVRERGDSSSVQILLRSVFADLEATDGGAATVRSDWRATVRSPAVRAGVERVARLKPMIVEARGEGNWLAAVSDFAAGRAGMYVMGDWVKAEFLRLGARPGVDVGCLTIPGNEKILTLTIDALAFSPTGDPDARAGQDLLVDTAIDPDVQVAISAAKGSMPPRNDIDVGRLDPCAAKVRTTLNDPAVRFHQFQIGNGEPEVIEIWHAIGELALDPAVTTEETLRLIDQIAARPPAGPVPTP
jgi:glucose/mannose transport system substrate-binding protein